MTKTTDLLRSLAARDDETADVICRETVTRKLTLLDECHEHCERTYLLYLPTAVCENQKKEEPTDVLPLVFAIHCLGCSPNTMMHWTAVAEDFNFVLVIPKGIHNSFNAQHCCGYALEHDLDDVGFLETVIAQLSDEYDKLVSQEAVYAMGWSNGGYMVSYAAHLFRAIAPISGFQVDLPITADHNKPIGLFLHHAVDDRFVRITGCCTNSSMPSCCCSLDSFADQCITAQEHFEAWSTTINHCTSSTGGGGGSSLSVSFEDTASGVVCWTAGANGDCQANTTFCQHQHGGHFNRPSFQKAFPMTKQIADFFARDACSMNSGSWSGSSRRCSCPNADSQGSYCLVVNNKDESAALTSKQTSKQSLASEKALVGPLVAITFLCCAGIAFFLKSKQTRRYAGFRKVSTVELQTM